MANDPDHSFDAARAVVAEGVQSRAFPAAVVSVGSSREELWREAFGKLSYADDAGHCTAETIFDLASLTKVVATTSIAMRQAERGLIRLDAPVAAVLPEFSGNSKTAVTIRHLLDHSSGLPARARLWETCSGRSEYLRAICELALERQPGDASVYSDPGFILLGLLLEATGGASLDTQFTHFRSGFDASPAPLRYLPPAEWVDRTAPTEDDPWRGRVLRGDVHDENAAALGGVAGHAGLVGTAAAVGTFARLVLRTFRDSTDLGHPETMRLFSARTGGPHSSRALGWDTALPTSSCGRRMSPRAIGHTGFTGTSLWIDPERDVYAVLLTNRVHPTRQNEGLLPLRARFHDALPF